MIYHRILLSKPKVMPWTTKLVLNYLKICFTVYYEFKIRQTKPIGEDESAKFRYSRYFVT